MMTQEFFGNPLRAWSLSLLLAVVSYAALRLLQSLLERRVRAITPTTITRMDDLAVDILRSTRHWYLLCGSLYLASKPLHLPVTLDTTLDRIMILALVLQSAIWGNGLIRFWLDNYFRKQGQEDMAIASTIGLISLVSKAALYALLTLVALNNFGVNVTALVAGLGVGGIAVALAAQNILGDLFASLTIVLDKPFVVGDFIIVDELMGTVEEVGLKTTRVRSLSGEQLIFPNASLLQSRIRNFKRMRERRVTLSIGVTYETPLDRLKEIPGIILSTISRLGVKVRTGRVTFKDFGSSSLNFEAEYWVLDPDMTAHMNIHQEISFELIRLFAEKGIEFAYPTQTVHVRNGAC